MVRRIYNRAITATEVASLYDNFVNVSSERKNNIPIVFSLGQNYPNPFNPNTTISYSIPNTSLVRLKIFNILGQEVATLINEEKLMGNYEINFDASSLSSGVYIYKIQAGSFVESKKMILLK